MAVRTTVIDDDGLHKAIQTTVKLGKRGRATKADQAAIERLLTDACEGATFEGAIRDADRFWRGVTADPKAKRLSKAWYAAEIRRQIRWVRKIVALQAASHLDPKRLEEWVVSGMRLGALLNEAEWRFGLVANAARYGVKQHASARVASPLGVATRAELATIRKHDLKTDVQNLRRGHKDWSDRRVAQQLLPKRNPTFEPSGVETKARDALAKRIGRLNLNK